MGVDFISSTADSHTKAWSAEFRKATSDLFAQSCGTIDRTFLAEPTGGSSLKEGDLVSVRLVNDRVWVYRDICADAEIKKPTLDLIENLNSCYGFLPAYVSEINGLANVVSVRIGQPGAQ